jgi:WD40 repeat protein
VLSVDFAPGGQTFASGGNDNSAKVWDIPMRPALRDLPSTESVTAVAVSADGKSLSAGSKDGSIHVWNAADAKASFRLTGHVGPVTGLAYAANGQLLASTGTDQTLRFWNPVNGQVVGVVGAHSAPALALALAANGTTAYTAGADGMLKVWQLPPVASRPLPPHGDTVSSLALSADGAILATGCLDKNVRVLNFDNGQLARTLPTPTPVTATAYTGAAAAALTAAGTAGGQIIIWGAADAKPIFQVQAHAGEVTKSGHCQWSRRGRWSIPPTFARPSSPATVNES